MTNPCPGFGVSTPYGVPGNWAAGVHTGEDYACPSGTRIVAAATGRVVKNSYDSDYGNLVELETDGIRHRYCHLRERGAVWPGITVGVGEFIGYAGSTGRSTGPHLHYEERHGPGFGYHDHQAPTFPYAGGQAPPAEQPGTEEEDMFVIVSPNRPSLLVGPGYAKELNEEEAKVMTDFGVRRIEHNDRAWDVAKAACLHGEATD